MKDYDSENAALYEELEARRNAIAHLKSRLEELEESPIDPGLQRRIGLLETETKELGESAKNLREKIEAILKEIL